MIYHFCFCMFKFTHGVLKLRENHIFWNEDVGNRIGRSAGNTCSNTFKTKSILGRVRRSRSAIRPRKISEVRVIHKLRRVSNETERGDEISSGVLNHPWQCESKRGAQNQLSSPLLAYT
ncbi:hypothetical protein ACP275_11G091700 [Erythranthe tilingii]